MVRERGLAAAMVLRFEKTARRFLREQATIEEVFAPEALTGADINAFLLREVRSHLGGVGQRRVAELRSLLRFLYLRGIIASPLGTAVPPAGGRRLAGVPPIMTAADIHRAGRLRQEYLSRRPRLRNHDSDRPPGLALLIAIEHESDMVPAVNQLYRGAEYPSRLTLPVISR